MLAYMAISRIGLGRKLREAVLLHDNIYQSDRVNSAFVLGFFKPRIYVPFGIEERELETVIEHERAHIRRRDNKWKPLGFAILAVHWFNPLVWLSYVLFCRDIEFACDEKVIKSLTTNRERTICRHCFRAALVAVVSMPVRLPSVKLVLKNALRP